VNPTPPSTVAQHRLKWKCRRGLLELDLVLERFLQHRAAALDEQSLDLLNELLDYQDNDLWDIVNGRSEDYLPRHKALVDVLRQS
jgi:antitoxin CptB